MQVLEVLLPQGMIVPSAFETVGHIAHLNLRDEHFPYKKLIAKVPGFYTSTTIFGYIKFHLISQNAVGNYPPSSFLWIVFYQVVLDKNRPKIQTVVNKIDVIHNDYRTMQLEVLAGNHSLVTTVAENGLYFDVDLAAV